MTLRRNDEQEVRELLALRPTDDLTDDERRRVDEALLYSEECRDELAGYEKCLAVLQAAAAEPLPTDGRPSIWKRVEPRLGPPRRFPPRRFFASIPTYWLTAAVFLLAAGNLYLLTVGRTTNNQNGLNGQLVADKTHLPAIPGPSATGETSFVNNRYPVLVDPRDEHGRVRPLLGIVVMPCEGDDGGVEIQSIIDGTSAEDAGLQVGDILLSVDGKKINNPGCLIGCLKQHGVGQRIELVFVREGRRQKANIFLGGLVQMGDRNFLIKRSPVPPELIDQQ
jgi:hypothetical protein